VPVARPGGKERWLNYLRSGTRFKGRRGRLNTPETAAWQPLSAPSASARNDVDQRDEGNDDHGGNRDDGDGGGGEEHPVPFFRDLLVENLVRSGHLGE
jgi:hypothetical protein